jgi:hypothetical protein
MTLFSIVPLKNILANLPQANYWAIIGGKKKRKKHIGK